MNTSTRKIVVIVVFLAGLALGYWLFGYSEPVQAESISPVLERLSTLEKSLARIEDCACAEPCEYIGVVTRPVYIPITERLTTTVVITQVVPMTTTITSTTVVTVTPVPTADVPTPEPTPVPTQEPVPMQEPKPMQHCNQGVGNGPEGCDPGNSNHRHESNDEGTNADGSDKVPGNGGRKNEKVHKPKKVRGRSGK